MQRTATLLTALLAPVALFAQDPAAAPTASQSALVIRTDAPTVAMGVLSSFGSEEDLPELSEGQVFVLSLDDGGAVNVRAGEGSGWLDIQARPPQLMEIFAEQVAQYRQMGQMIGGMMMAQQGMDPEATNRVIAALFDFPKQVETLSLRIPSNPEETGGLDLSLGLSPLADTGFDQFVTSLKSASGGVRKLPGKGAMIRGDFNVDLSAIHDEVQTLSELFGTMGIQDAELKEQTLDLNRRFAETMTGTGSFLFGADGLRFLAGAKQPDALKALLHSEAYAEAYIAGAEASGQAKATMEPIAFEHGDVAVSRTVVEFDDPSAVPFVDDGIVRVFSAVAGDSLVITGFGTDPDATVKALIDDVLADRIPAEALDKGVLARFEIDLPALAEMMSEFGDGQPAPDEGMPARLDMVLSKQNRTLTLQVKAK